MKKCLFLNSRVIGISIIGIFFANCALISHPSDIYELHNLGEIEFKNGNFINAIDYWEKARKQLPKNNSNQIDATLILNIATAQYALGNINHAFSLLNNVETLISQKKIREDSLISQYLKITKGAIASFSRKSEDSKILSEQIIAKDNIEKSDTEIPQALAACFNDTGLTKAVTQTKENKELAIDFFQDAINAAQKENDLVSYAKSTLNQGITYFELGKIEGKLGKTGELKEYLSRATKNFSKARKLAVKSPNGYNKSIMFLTLGETYKEFVSMGYMLKTDGLMDVCTCFVEALKSANKNPWLSSLAYGNLGELYFEQGRFKEALSLARNALAQASTINSLDLLYKWNWLLGKIKKHNDKTFIEAVEHYDISIEQLKAIRHDVAIATSLTSSFRDEVGDLYHEAADINLEIKEFKTAQQYIEKFKEAEVEDYFQGDCINIFKRKKERLEINNIDKHAALIYIIPQQEKTRLLVETKNGLKLFTSPTGAREITTKSKALRNAIDAIDKDNPNNSDYLRHSQDLYKYLFIDELDIFLKTEDVKTLIFVPDGPLRTIPMSVLHDGQKFLINEYAIATLPGLWMINNDTTPKQRTRPLLVGLTLEIENYSTLDVTGEFNKIKRSFPNSIELVGSKFTKKNLNDELRSNQFSIVHIASHAKFLSKANDYNQTFILSGGAKKGGDKITFNDIESFFLPLNFDSATTDLLVLSACETAKGDDQAALGLAGVAAKSGVRSVLASLWPVSDKSTSLLMDYFYQNLAKGQNKAESLQSAQRQFIENAELGGYKHPFYWSAFLLVGDWRGLNTELLSANNN